MFPRKMDRSTQGEKRPTAGVLVGIGLQILLASATTLTGIATDRFVAGASHNGSMPQSFSFLRTAAVSVSWQQRLSGALTEDEIIRLVKDYLAAWTPEELARLPLNCRPGAIKDGEDVTSYAFAMVQHQCMAGPHEAELDHIATFFAAASHRISQILAAVTTSAANQEHS